MNDFNCILKQYVGKNSYRINGLKFSNTALVNIEIDFENIFSYKGFDDTFIFYSELFDSSKCDGNFLIFTTSNGFSDEGGWDGVRVKHSSSEITWALSVENIDYRFTFDKEKYINEINKVGQEIINLQPFLTLELENVIYPLDWSHSS